MNLKFHSFEKLKKKKMEGNTTESLQDIIKKNPFYSNLSPSDQLQYRALQRKLASQINRYNRNKRIETFQENLNEIKKFCVRNDENDWKRYIACGICWIKDGICINTRQLRILLGKSKSAINGTLQKMGYDTIAPKGNDAEPLIEVIPYLKNNFSEKRQWSIRKYNIHFQNNDSINSCEEYVQNKNESICNCSESSVQNDDSICNCSEISAQNNDSVNCCAHCHSKTESIDKYDRKPCAFGCTCGCDCKINGEATRPCTCIYPDDSYEYGKGVCHCERIIGMGQVQPILIDETVDGSS